MASQQAGQPPSGMRRRLVISVSGLGVLLYLVLGALSASLGRIEVSDLPARSLSSVQSVFARSDAVVAARQAWCQWHGYRQRSVVVVAKAGQPAPPLPDSDAARCVRAFYDSAAQASASGDGTAGRLVRWYVVLDVLFICVYVSLSLGLILRRHRSLQGATGIDAGLRAATDVAPRVLLFGGLLAAEGAEAVAQWILGSSTASEGMVDAAGTILAFAPTVKLMFAGVLVLLVGVLVMRPYVEVATEVDARGMKLAPAGLVGTRTAGLLRMQIAIVVVFGLLMAGVGQDQVPDALLPQSSRLCGSG